MQLSLFNEETKATTIEVVNVASVPKRSPFRYPGGKTWFVPYLRKWLSNSATKSGTLVEPFAGGGVVSLTAVFENLAARAFMTEIDADVAAVWKAILGGDAEWLAGRIEQFDLTKEHVAEVLRGKTLGIRDHAFLTILRNRINHGGILAPGSGILNFGENGKGIRSLWYPQTLARRIREIAMVADRLSFEEGNAFAVLERFRDKPDAVFFIDPPYTAGGKNAGSRLYTHFDVDHKALFSICAALVGDFVMTYDNTWEVRELAAQFGFEARSVAMNNTHHAVMTELVVGRDLSWMD
jgi:DNA adenine methylase